MEASLCEVLSLPPKIFHDVWLPMSPLQAWAKHRRSCWGPGPSQKTLRRHEVRWYRRILSLKNTQMARGILGERAAARSFDALSLFRS